MKREGLISEILEATVFKVTYNENEVSEVNISVNDYNKALDDVIQRINVRFVKNKFSTLLLKQLARHSMQIGEKFGNAIHYYHLPSILDLLEAHEKGHEINVRGVFKGSILGPYKLNHLHHDSITFISKNIQGYWHKQWKSSGMSEENYQSELLNNEYAKLTKEYTPTDARKMAISVLLNKILMGNIAKAAKEQTGEWVVFKEVGGINYYLCLASHEEDDLTVLARAKDALKEFDIFDNEPL